MRVLTRLISPGLNRLLVWGTSGGDLARPSTRLGQLRRLGCSPVGQRHQIRYDRPSSLGKAVFIIW